MKLFHRQSDNPLIRLLKTSNQSFKFDPNQTRYRLMQSLEKVSQTVLPVAPAHSWHLMQYGIAFASVVVFVSGTFAFASNAKPGDTLFGVNKFGEQVMLTLPLNAETKADIQAKIVTKRLEALDELEVVTGSSQTATTARKLKTIAESDKSLNAAIEAVTANKKAYEAKGKTKSAQHLSEVLNRLQGLASQHAARIEELENENDDEDTKQEMREHLLKIQQARQKALLELDLEDEPEKD